MYSAFPYKVDFFRFLPKCTRWYKCDFFLYTVVFRTKYKVDFFRFLHKCTRWYKCDFFCDDPYDKVDFFFLYTVVFRTKYKVDFYVSVQVYPLVQSGFYYLHNFTCWYKCYFSRGCSRCYKVEATFELLINYCFKVT